MMEPSSAQQVLELPELLMLILLEDTVDVKTLLLAQRVSKTFEATIQGSARLLRKLWLLPDTSEKDLEVTKLLKSTTWGRETRSPLICRRPFDMNMKRSLRLHLEVSSLVGDLPSNWKSLQVVRSRNEKVEMRCRIGGSLFDRNRGEFVLIHEEWETMLDATTTVEALLRMARDKIRERNPGLIAEK